MGVQIVLVHNASAVVAVSVAKFATFGSRNGPSPKSCLPTNEFLHVVLGHRWQQGINPSAGLVEHFPHVYEIPERRLASLYLHRHLAVLEHGNRDGDVDFRLVNPVDMDLSLRYHVCCKVMVN